MNVSLLLGFMAVTTGLEAQAAAGQWDEARRMAAEVAMAPSFSAGAFPGSVLPSPDSLYRLGREALNAGRFSEAASIFARLTGEYPRSEYAGDALYYEAFARQRLGDTANLRRALRALERQEREYPESARRSDNAGLSTRIRGELARRGDAEQGERVARAAARAATPPATPSPPAVPSPGQAAATPRAPSPPRAGRAGDVGQPAQGCPSEENDERLMALNALLHMDSDLAIPTLKRVLERRDACSELLRRRAVFLVAQKRSPESTDILLQAVKTDPDPEVQEQAVFWMGQVRDERAVDVLQELLASAATPEIQDRAIFALSQHRSERAGAALRTYAERADAPVELRRKAIFWLAQHRSSENAGFLRDLYGKLQEQSLREQVLQSLSQTRDPANAGWLLSVAQSDQEPMELRKKALFWAGQGRVLPMSELTGLYDKVTDREMKETLVFLYSQRRDSVAVDKLMDIARRETDSELRQKAIFWLGQSKDPRAVRILEELINR